MGVAGEDVCGVGVGVACMQKQCVGDEGWSRWISQRLAAFLPCGQPFHCGL